MDHFEEEDVREPTAAEELSYAVNQVVGKVEPEELKDIIDAVKREVFESNKSQVRSILKQEVASFFIDEVKEQASKEISVVLAEVLQDKVVGKNDGYSWQEKVEFVPIKDVIKEALEEALVKFKEGNIQEIIHESIDAFVKKELKGEAKKAIEEFEVELKEEMKVSSMKEVMRAFTETFAKSPKLIEMISNR